MILSGTSISYPDRNGTWTCTSVSFTRVTKLELVARKASVSLAMNVHDEASIEVEVKPRTSSALIGCPNNPTSGAHVSPSMLRAMVVLRPRVCRSVSCESAVAMVTLPTSGYRMIGCTSTGAQRAHSGMLKVLEMLISASERSVTAGNVIRRVSGLRIE